MDYKELPKKDRRLIDDAVKQANKALPGLNKEQLMDALEEFGELPRKNIPDPISLLPTPWLIKDYWKQPVQLIKELFRRWKYD